jgi:hypothetical protein
MALSQIGREEKAAAADKVSPIVRHRTNIAQLKVMGSLRSTHPTDFRWRIRLANHYDEAAN